jgi:hypothetical protein
MRLHKRDGNRCGGPAKDPSDYCYHHQGLKDRFNLQKVTVPPLDDQNAIQVAIMDVVNGLLSNRVARAAPTPSSMRFRSPVPT